MVSNSLRPHVPYSLWNSPGQNTGVGTRSLLQGIFPIQGLNPGLPHCRWILYQLNHQRNPITWVGNPNCSSQWLYSPGDHGLRVSTLYNLSYNSSTGFYNCLCLSACLFSMNERNERKWKIFCHQVIFSQKTIDSRAYLNPWLYI